MCKFNFYTTNKNWIKRILIGFYNIISMHKNSQIHPKTFVKKIKNFNKCIGWDYKYQDGY